MTAGLAIRRYRARLPVQAEPVAARLALQALAADLEDAVPRGLPPQALLWLRHVRVQLSAGALRRGTSARGAGVAQGREQIDAALSRAARPALGPVAPDAEAVLFADEAEMLACLALAAQAGQLDRWWWRGLLGARWPAWQVAWAERPAAQAVALRLLQRVSPSQAMSLLAGSGVDEDGRPVPPSPAVPPAGAGPAEVAASAAAPHDWPRHGQPHGAAVDGTSSDPLAAEPSVASGTTPELPRVLQGGPRRLPRVPLIGLATAPAAPGMPPERTPDRQAPVRHGVLRAADPEPAAYLLKPSVPGRGAEPVQAAAGPPPPLAERPAAAGEGTGPAAPMHDPMPRLSTRESRQALTPLPGPAPAPSPAATPAAAWHRATEGHRTTTPRPSDDLPLLAEAPVTWPWPQACISHQGPLLFLVNQLLEDGLYPDFTRPMDPGLPVPLWALLGALAQAWRLPPDPLQALLAEQADGWHPGQLRADLPAAPGVAPGPWADWLPAFARCLRQRLCRRLGLPPRRWASALHRGRPGRLWASAAAWELELDLADHDIAWRLAGLDRDPGWLPTTDLSLRFRFT